MITNYNASCWRIYGLWVTVLTCTFTFLVPIYAQRNSGSAPTIFRHSSDVSSVEFLPDGKHILSGYGTEEDRGGLLLWNTTSSGSPESSLINGKTVNQLLSVAKDGNLLCLTENASGVNVIQVVSTSRPKEFHPIPNVNGINFQCIAMSPDGKTLLAGGGDFQSNQPAVIMQWSRSGNTYSRSRLLGKYLYAATIFSVAYSPDGKLIAGVGNDYDAGVSELKIWNAKTNNVQANIINGKEGLVSKLIFSPNYNLLAVVGDSIGLRDSHGKLLHLLHIKNHANSAIFSPDGKYLIVGERSSQQKGLIKVWETKTFRLISTVVAHQGAINDLAFSPNGLLLASASADKTVKIWNFQQIILTNSSKNDSAKSSLRKL